MDVAGDELLRLLVRERYPTWWAVLNEDTAAAIADHARQQQQALDGGPEQSWRYDTEFLVRRRRAILNEALSAPDDHGHLRAEF